MLIDLNTWEGFPSWSHMAGFYPIETLPYEEMHKRLLLGYSIAQMPWTGGIQWFQKGGPDVRS